LADGSPPKACDGSSIWARQSLAGTVHRPLGQRAADHRHWHYSFAAGGLRLFSFAIAIKIFRA